MNIYIKRLMQYAWDNGISCILTDKLDEYTPSSANPDKNIVLINLKWHNPSEIAFQMAHELGHVINQDEGILYFSSFSNKSKFERQANLKALDILIPIYLNEVDTYSDNSVMPFMESFGIPTRLEDDVVSAFCSCIKN
ncbi:ImmA/IrrE family metallo-endopeptidase [Lactiplantibacillus plantarum]|uniref:ImmA/IrrE family metallo-endopeptidase n=2 Tax=Lactiplantibacillus plantarum TaxID=1590 RepID=UPI001F2B3C2E|nr:ImmA/IrrE family metallo-endopeptidase [Lactiplantibacillus plantarum]